jgi:hypothetical protein
MILFLALVLTFSHAAEREIEGGDILYTAKVHSEDAAAAQFLSQQAAIKSLITECSIPHREIKIFKTEVSDHGSYYTGESIAGLSFEDCQEGKRAKPEQKERLLNPEITKNQKLYEEYLGEKLGVNRPVVKPVDHSKELKAIYKKLMDLNEKLENQPEPTEKIIVIHNAPSRPQPQALPRPAQSVCMAQYNSLMEQARIESLGNYPPGNLLGSDRSRALVNQAQMVRSACQ